MYIDQLRYFLVASERGNLTEAANELLISQSALTRSMQKLESEIGKPLFQRESRTTVLTDAGRVLQAGVRRMLATLEETKSQINGNALEGSLCIGAIPTVAPYFLPRVLKQFGKQFPDTLVNVQEDVTTNLIRRCSEGDIDIAILAAPAPENDLQEAVLFEEELVLVLPDSHPLVKNACIHFEDLEPFPFVLLEKSHCLADGITSICRSNDFEPDSTATVNQLSMVEELVALSHGISMIPAMAVDQSNRKNRVYRSITGKKPTRTIMALWRPGSFKGTEFASFLKGIAPDIR